LYVLWGCNPHAPPGGASPPGPPFRWLRWSRVFRSFARRVDDRRPYRAGSRLVRPGSDSPRFVGRFGSSPRRSAASIPASNRPLFRVSCDRSVATLRRSGQACVRTGRISRACAASESRNGAPNRCTVRGKQPSDHAVWYEDR
jgi:hypothetical protein